MPYNKNIPQPTDQISVSQGDILNNFQFLNTIASGIFDSPVQVGAPVIPAGDTALYTLLFATTGHNEMFIVNDVGTAIPMTASQTGGVSGWTYLPSQMKIVWGRDTIGAGFATKTTLFSSVAGFPGFTTASLGIQITRVHNATSTNFIQLDSNTNLQFIARRSTSTTSSADTYTWLAIGL